METTLYDKGGRPIAYISPENDNAVYLWDGHAVCYIDGERIFGWKGKHIGWFVNKIVYDIKGYRTGFTKETCPLITYIESVKNVKYVKYVKCAKYVPYAKPTFSTANSDMGLKDFLEQDRI